MGFQAAKCPGCRGDIQIPTDRESAKCMLCGRDLDVQAALAASHGSSAGNWMHLAKAAADSGNHDEAYRYFTKVLEVEPTNHLAWFGKATAAGWDSDLRRDRFRELVSGIEKALELAPPAERETLSKRAGAAIDEITTAYFHLSLRHTHEFISLDSTWEEHVERCRSMLKALRFAHSLDPKSQQLLRNTIDLAQSIIEGVAYKDEHDRSENGTPSTKVREIPPALEEQVQATRTEAIAKLRAIDPTFQPEKIRKATDGSCLMAIVGIVMIAALVGAAYFVVTHGKDSGSEVVGAELEGTWRRVGDAKAGMRVCVSRQKDEVLGTVVGTPSAADLRRGYSVNENKARDVAQCFVDAWPLGVTKWKGFKRIDKDSWSVIDRGQAIEFKPDGSCAVNVARGETFPEATLTRDSSGSLTLRYKGKGDDEKQTWVRDDTPAPVATEAAAASGSAKPARPAPAAAASSNGPVVCKPCASQEDFDALTKSNSKCCPVIACKGDVDCLGGRVCCKIPDGQICGDAARCTGSNRVQPKPGQATPPSREDSGHCQETCIAGCRGEDPNSPAWTACFDGCMTARCSGQKK